MDQRRQALVPQRWLRGIRRVVLPGLTIAGVLACWPNELPAQSGWKWGNKSPQTQGVAPKTAPRNGFATTIHKLQADAKQKAFDGDIDGAIASAQRARKIAEASSALVSADAECSVEAADRLVQKLMAVKSATATLPGAPASSPSAIAARHTGASPSTGVVAAHQPGWQDPTPRTSAQAAASRPLVASSQRPLTVFTPHLVAAQIEPPPVIAGGWLLVEDENTMLADDPPIEAIEDVAASHVPLVESQSEFVLPQQSSARSAYLESSSFSIVRSRDSSSNLSTSDNEPAAQGNARRVWQRATPEIAPAVGVEVLPARNSRDDQFQLLQQVEPAETEGPQAEEPATNSSPAIQPLESRFQPYRRNTDSNPAMEHADESVVTAHVTANSARWRSLAETDAEHPNSATAEVTPTAYSASQSTPTAPADEGLLDAPVSAPPVWFRDVEPLAVSTSESPDPSRLPPLQFVEQLAAWIKLPVQTVTAGLVGLGLILLGVGLCLMRFAARSRA